MKIFIYNILFFTFLSSLSQGSSISLNYVVGGGSVSGTEVVGLNGVPADGWVGLSSTDTTASPVDIDGGSGSATITYKTGYSFNASPSQDGSNNALMMKRGMRLGNTTQDVDPVVSGLGSEFTASGYDVYIYFGTDAHGRTHRFTVNDGTVHTNSGKEQPTSAWQGSFVPTAADTDVGNYMVFSGLTGSSFTISNNGTSPGKPGITGIEIVSSNHALRPSIESFNADSTYVTPGTPVTLSWETTKATSISIDPGIGDVTSISSPGGAGSTQIVATATATYTLTASNLDGSVSGEVEVAVGPARPNIVFFVVDDMGPQDTAVPFNVDTNGNPVAYAYNNFYVTPNMESLAASGMRFTSAYAQSVCSPTRCGIMTGQNSTRHAVTTYVGGFSSGSPPNSRRDGLGNADITLPKLLQLGNYRTIHVGKGHFSRNGTGVDISDLGFDVNIAGGRWGQPPNGYLGTPGYGLPGLEAYDGSMFLTKALSIEANKAVENAVDEGRPFYLYMSFYAVHTPYAFNPDATGDYSAAYGGTNSAHAKFATMVEGMDIAVGSIRQKLVDLGVAEDTLIVFIGDNGTTSPGCTVNGLSREGFSDWPMRGKKGARWEGGIRVPMIVSWASTNSANAFQQAIPIPANSIETDIVTAWDIPVTLLRIAGLSGDPSFGQDGYDLSPYFAGTAGGPHRPQKLIIHFPHRHNNSFFSLIRKGDMKLIYNYADNTHQLYNLATDPTESTDLAASQPETLSRMARALAQGLNASWGTSGVLLPSADSRITWATNGNVVSIPNDPSVDVDGDGLSDTTEDPDLDGLVDAGELDPDNDNTDGDGTIDGAEVRTGTDPLDPADDFVSEWIHDGSGSFSITWPSKPGAFYEIQTTDNLMVWSNAPVAAVPATDPGTTTSYTFSASTGSRKFYRIVLLP